MLAVVEPVGFPFAPGAAPMVPVAKHQAREEQRVRSAPEDTLGRLQPELLSGLLQGVAGQALLEASGDFDLMVVGSRGDGPLRRTLLGSTSRRLFSGAGCSVLALPRGPESGAFGAAEQWLDRDASPDAARERP